MYGASERDIMASIREATWSKGMFSAYECRDRAYSACRALQCAPAAYMYVLCMYECKLAAQLALLAGTSVARLETLDQQEIIFGHFVRCHLAWAIVNFLGELSIPQARAEV